MDDNVVWVAFAFALVGRVADVVSTRIVTPGLLLEGNWLVRRFGWAYAWISVAVALLAFLSPPAGIIIGTVSCLMAHSNMSFALISRYATGEQGIRKLHAQAIRNCGFGGFVAIFIVQFGPLLALALLILSFVGYSLDNRVADVGYGILFWVAMIALHKLKVLRYLGTDKRVSPNSC